MRCKSVRLSFFRPPAGYRFVFLCAVITGCWACRRPVSDAPIVGHYATAACIPFAEASPHSRKWDSAITLADGSKIVISGAQIPGGRVSVHYLSNGQTSSAADAGAYVYPSDVRLDSGKDLLYVKATGLAGGIRLETWLFEYDLRARQLLEKELVADNVLPPECPEKRTE